MIARVTLTNSTHKIQHESETVANEGLRWVSNGFPFYGVSPVLVIVLSFVLIALVVGYILTAKGTGSHAGREQVRRQYRRSLAREMAKQDADAIRAGTKKRRWYYKW